MQYKQVSSIYNLMVEAVSSTMRYYLPLLVGYVIPMRDNSIAFSVPSPRPFPAKRWVPVTAVDNKFEFPKDTFWEGDWYGRMKRHRLLIPVATVTWSGAVGAVAAPSSIAQ